MTFQPPAILSPPFTRHRRAELSRNMAAAAVAVLWAGITVVAFVFLIAFWAILTGILELVAAFRIDFTGGRGWLIFDGILSVLYGILLIVAPNGRSVGADLVARRLCIGVRRLSGPAGV